MQIRCQDSELFVWFERPAMIVALTARMLLAAGLFIALFLKLYMFLLTDLRCEAEVESLGNTLRCSGVLEMISGTLILVTGLGVAAAFFSRSGIDLGETLSMVLCAVAITLLSGVAYETATWESAAMIVSMVAAFVGLVLLGRSGGFGSLGRPKTNEPSNAQESTLP